jgi:hypothetical protein
LLVGEMEKLATTKGAKGHEGFLGKGLLEAES